MLLEQMKEAVDFINSRTEIKPSIGIILGTGLGGLVKEIDVINEIPYKEIPHFPVSTVESHSGKLIFGKLGDKQVVAMQGRFHYYEGYTMQQVTFPVRVMKLLGITNLFVSNASGGVNPDFEVGEIMIQDDHIDLFPAHPQNPQWSVKRRERVFFPKRHWWQWWCHAAHDQSPPVLHLPWRKGQECPPQRQPRDRLALLRPCGWKRCRLRYPSVPDR